MQGKLSFHFQGFPGPWKHCIGSCDLLPLYTQQNKDCTIKHNVHKTRSEQKQKFSFNVEGLVNEPKFLSCSELCSQLSFLSAGVNGRTPCPLTGSLERKILQPSPEPMLLEQRKKC